MLYLYKQCDKCKTLIVKFELFTKIDCTAVGEPYMDGQNRVFDLRPHGLWHHFWTLLFLLAGHHSQGQLVRVVFYAVCESCCLGH